MSNWNVPAHAGREGDRTPDVADLMEALGRPHFATRLMDLAHGLFDAGSMCAYRLSRSTRPTFYCSASREATDRTGSCWKIYRNEVYRADETFEPAYRETARGTPATSLVVGHLTADEVRYAPHRKRIYGDHALLDRLTVASRETDGDLLAVNFYHHRDQGHFSDGQIARFEAIASTAMAAVRRDHELQHMVVAAPGDGSVDGSRQDRIAAFEARLARREPGLTQRERAVCARLLIGMLYEGIAADLGISLATVKTYRKRAFDRLDIHFRNELYGLAIGLGRP